MKKILIIIIIIILLILGILFINKSITGNAIKEKQSNINIYTYTKAICNSSNYCQDYEIICEDNKIKSITPITGAVIQFDEEWKDPRAREEKEKLC